MRIDIIEVENKKFKIKIIIIYIVTLLLIALFSMLGIYCAQKYQQNCIKNNKHNSIQKVEKQQNKNEEKIESQSKIENIQEDKSNIKEKETKKIDISNIYSKDTKIAYLTFDDGPSTAVTPLILDVLKEENIKATFFVLGTNVKKNSDILKRIYKKGHYIANHG